MEDKILKQIESEALKLFPLDEYDDELFSERYNWRNGAKFGYNIKESVDEKLVCDIQKYLKDDVDLGFLKKKDVERINYYLDTFFKSKSATKNTESNEGEKWVRVEDRLPERLNYCVEVDRGGIGEESMVLHYSFDKEPTRDEILKLIESEDCGYDDDYCRFDYYLINPPKEK